jgi:hypothetical protein
MKQKKPAKSAEQRKLDKIAKQYIPQNRTTLTARVIVQGQPGAGMKWQGK